MQQAAVRTGLGSLQLASIGFLVANLVHGADHQRQGTERLATEVLAGGTALTLLAIVTVVLALRRHPRAPAIAAATGITAALGVTAAHLLPHWSALSDSYPDIGVDALSWAVVLLEIAAGAVLGYVGLRGLRR